MRHSIGIASTLVLVLAAGAAADETIVTFDDGTEGWSGPQGPGGATTVEPTGGNPGAHLHTVFNNFGIEFRNSTHHAFVGDYTTNRSVTISVDLKVEDISFFGSPVTRPWVLDLRNFDLAQGGYPYASVWYEFDWVGATQYGEWTTFSVTIEDTGATELPPGWGGSGDETPTAEPTLPPGVTFADVLAGVDEIAFTTLEPGYFFGFTDFDVRVDTIAIQTSSDCVGDVDGSGAVDVDDLLAIILAWGPCDGCPEDLDGNLTVDVDDLLACLLAWGRCR